MQEYTLNENNVEILFDALDPLHEKVIISYTLVMNCRLYSVMSPYLTSGGAIVEFKVAYNAVDVLREALTKRGWTRTSNELDAIGNSEIWLLHYSDPFQSDQERVNSYINSNGMICPWCGSHNIDGGSNPDFGDNGRSYLRVSCGNCGKVWFDEYKLVGIFTDEKVTDDPEHHFVARS